MLNQETLSELEEIAPHDFFSKCEKFENAALDFFDEADFSDAFKLKLN